MAALAVDRQREYRRLVLVSAALHLALVVGFALRAPSFDAPTNLPPVVSLIPASALAPPKPAEKPAPPPEVAKPAPPKPPELAKTVIPEDNQKLPKPKPKPKPEPEPAEEDVDLDEFLDQLREEVPPGPTPPPQPTAKPVQGPTGPGVLVTPEVLAWMEKVKRHVRARWGHDPRFRGKSLSTDVLVTLTASGDVLDFEITRRSGNPWYDESVERFLLKESPLPPPPKGGDWPIRFTPGDLL
jgi:protein TonB